MRNGFYHKEAAGSKRPSRMIPRVGAICRPLTLALLWVWLGVASGPAGATPPLPEVEPAAPTLANATLECSLGYASQEGINGRVPAGWTAVLLNGDPRLNSTRREFAGGCDKDGFIERIEGQDSWAFLSQDIETPPEPGKPFDAVLYQQVDVSDDIAYSLSGWMVSLCGGSFSNPNDCPPGYYMSKMLGIDPAGGTDPLAPSVIWVEDLRNFTESRWVNLRLGTTAHSEKLTVFARIRSPFRWHGNHAFVDAYSLMRAPTATFASLPATVKGRQMTVGWTGVQSADIAAIPGGTYRLYFDVQYRRAGQAGWTDWRTGQPAGQAIFYAPVCGTETYEFRLRARSEQPDSSGGAWPNHRYPGDWSAPASVRFEATPCLPRARLPLVRK